jgi:hypothetical protein
VADSPLNLAGSGIELFGDAGIQLLGNPVNDIIVLNNHLDRFSQEVISLDMGRDANGQENVCYLFFYVPLRGLRHRWNDFVALLGCP